MAAIAIMVGMGVAWFFLIVLRIMCGEPLPMWLWLAPAWLTWLGATLLLLGGWSVELYQAWRRCRPRKLRDPRYKVMR